MDLTVKSELPGPGKGVLAESFETDGAQELQVEHRRDGIVELGHVGDDSTDVIAGPSGGGGTNPCDDYSNNQHVWKMENELYWKANTPSFPGYLDVDRAIAALRGGGNNVMFGHNDCGVPDRAPNQFLTYTGTTANGGDISAETGKCDGFPDFSSTVGFGDLPRLDSGGRRLAYACQYYEPFDVGRNDVYESDIRFNKGDSVEWTTRGGDDVRCSDGNPDNNPWGMEAVMTHERGHTFGIAHVDEQSSPKLTMSPYLEGPCQTSESTLGRGDLRSLSIVYNNP